MAATKGARQFAQIGGHFIQMVKREIVDHVNRTEIHNTIAKLDISGMEP